MGFILAKTTLPAQKYNSSLSESKYTLQNKILGKRSCQIKIFFFIKHNSRRGTDEVLKSIAT